MATASSSYGNYQPSAVDPFPIESVLAKIVGDNNPVEAANMLDLYQIQNATQRGNYEYAARQQHEFAQQQARQQLQESYMKYGQEAAKTPGGLSLLNAQTGGAALGGFNPTDIETNLRAQQVAGTFEKAGIGAYNAAQGGYHTSLPMMQGLTGGMIDREQTPISSANVQLRADLAAQKPKMISLETDTTDSVGRNVKLRYQVPENATDAEVAASRDNAERLMRGSHPPGSGIPGATSPKGMSTPSSGPTSRPVGQIPGLPYKSGGAPSTDPTNGSALGMPTEYLPFYQEASARTGIPIGVLIAQGKQESNFRMDRDGTAGEVGIHQIKPSTARNPGPGMQGIDPATLRDPRVNINFAADYLKMRAGPRTDFSNPATVAAALKNYNGGGDPNYVANVLRYLPGGVPAQTAAVPSAPTPAPQAGPRLTSLPNNSNAPIPTPSANSPPSAPMLPSVAPSAQAAPPAPSEPAVALPGPTPVTPVAPAQTTAEPLGPNGLPVAGNAEAASAQFVFDPKIQGQARIAINLLTPEQKKDVGANVQQSGSGAVLPVVPLKGGGHGYVGMTGNVYAVPKAGSQ